MYLAKYLFILFTTFLFSLNIHAITIPSNFHTKAIALDLECEEELRSLHFTNKNGFQFNNALLLLINAHLVERFSDEEIKDKLKTWGFPEITIVEKKKTGMRFYVAANNEMALIIFRGTVVMRSWISNTFFNQRTAKLINMPGKLHNGFLRTFISVKHDLIKIFDDMDLWDKKTFFSGHSMGGAHALISALWLKAHGASNIGAIYTSAQPKVGNPEFMEYANKHFPDNYFRVTIDYDVTPHVPPTSSAAREFSNLISEKLPKIRNFFFGWISALNYAPHIGDPFVLGKSGTLQRISQKLEIIREKSFWSNAANELSIKNPIVWYKTIAEHFNIHAPNKYICELGAPIHD